MTNADRLRRDARPRRPSTDVVLSLLGLAACSLLTAWQRGRERSPLGRYETRRQAGVSARIGGLLTTADLRIVFQPIIATETGRLVGAEALSRFEAIHPADLPEPPDAVFADAAIVGLGVELELLAVRCALLAAEALPQDLYVSLNVSPAALLSPGLTDCLLRSTLPLNRVVLEITEHVSVTDYDVLAARAHEVRALGVRLAVDDAGAGFASFRHILRLAPEYIKLDRTLIEDISVDPARRALAAAVVLFAFEMGSEVVAEGVETLAELRTAQTLGIDAVQGFLLGLPTDDWATWAEWHSNGPLYRLRAMPASA
ncbi:MAG: EAL domain-containing protein [Frankiaceae bacterium]|nr:EAL domain-containing protein [Frankiaceae bacterium]